MAYREDDFQAAALARRELTSSWRHVFIDAINVAIMTDDAEAFRVRLSGTALGSLSISLNMEVLLLHGILAHGVTLNRLDMLTAYYRDFKVGRFFIDNNGITTVFTALISITRLTRLDTDAQLLEFKAKLEAIIRHLKLELKLPLATTMCFALEASWNADLLPLPQLARYAWPAFLAFAPYFQREETEGAFKEFWSNPYLSRQPINLVLTELILPYASDAELQGTHFSPHEREDEEHVDTSVRARAYTMVQNERIRRRVDLMKYLLLKDSKPETQWRYEVMASYDTGKMIMNYVDERFDST